MYLSMNFSLLKFPVKNYIQMPKSKLLKTEKLLFKNDYLCMEKDIHYFWITADNIVRTL